MASRRRHISCSRCSRAAYCISTRIYFDHEAGNADDSVLTLVPADRRGTLIAKHRAGAGNNYTFAVHLQGDNETVFF